jgi:alkylation response protein AidB-like acyl-CoA dehydrogenase
LRRYNFNHERWALTIQASRFARVCLEESFKYALKRKTFGKTLMEHPVIRAKIGEMARQVECTHAQLENITYQMCTLSKKDAMEKVRHHYHGPAVLRDSRRSVALQLGGPTALLKAQSTKVFEFCAREAAQIFGGASYVRGGQGEKVRVACVAPCKHC